jgi:hypothetical protein
MRLQADLSKFTVAVLFCTLVCAAARPLEATAQHQNTTLQSLALSVARVAVNEGALARRADAALVWQVTRNASPTPAGRAAWLASHSARVLGDRPCLRGNCFWTRHLNRAGTAPAGLPTEWTSRTARRWLDVLAYVDWLVEGDHTTDDPCPITPKTWGCAADRAHAQREGLYPIGCSGTLNDGYTSAKHCTLDGRWICAPKLPAAATPATRVLSASQAAGYARPDREN